MNATRADAPQRDRPIKTELLITHGTLVTMNPTRDLVADGAVAIDASRIVDIGPTSALLDKYEPATVIDAEHGPVLPGFVNAHFHLYSILHRGAPYIWDAGDLWTFLDIVYRRLLPGITSQEDRYYVMLLPLVEMIKAGFTCTIDLNEWLDVGGVEASYQAFDTVGMRGAVARSLQDRDIWDVGGPVHTDIRTAVSETAELAKKWKQHDRIDAWFYLVTPEQCSDELSAEATRLAAELDVGVATHLHEVADQVTRWKEETGYSPIQYYDAHDIPFLTPRHNAGHCVHVDDRDIELLAETGVIPVHNPMTNGGLGAGLAPVPKMLQADIPVALGVDDGSSNMFEVMRTALLFQKVTSRNAEVMSADTALTMATVNGAKAMLRDGEIGSLEPGKKADLIILDLNKPSTTPVSPPIATFLTYAASPENVQTVLIEGRIVMDNRLLTTVDEGEVVRKTQDIMDRILRTTEL